MASSVIEMTWLLEWRTDLQSANEITYETLGRNLDAYARSVSGTLGLNEHQERALAAALSASRRFVEQCYAKPLNITVQSLPDRAFARAAVDALITALDGAQRRPDEFL